MRKSGRFEKKNTASRKGLKIALVVACIAAMMVVGLTACGNKNPLKDVNTVEVDEIVTTAPAVQETEAAPAESAAPAQAEETTEAAAPETTAAAEVKIKSNPEDFCNYLIVCRPVQKDGGVKRTETMILATLNKRTKTMTLTQLLENAYVQTPEYKGIAAGEATLDTVYGKGSAGGKGTAGSMSYMNQTLYNNFGIEIDENFELDMKVFANLIRRLGDVQVELSEAEAKYLAEETKKDIQPGVQTMDGNLAMAYVQMWSDEDAEAVTGIEGQKKLMKAILQKVKTDYIANLENIVRETIPSITTSMDYQELKEFIVSLLPMITKLSIESGGTCPVEYQSEMMEINGAEQEIFRFDTAQATKAMRALTKGE